MVLGKAFSLIYYILLYPPYTLFKLLILNPVSYILYYTSLPFKAFYAYLHSGGSFVLDLVWSFETFFTYFSVAAVIGILTGLFLYATSQGFFWILQLQTSSDEKLEPLPPRSISNYRKEREIRKRMALEDLPTTPGWLEQSGDGLISQTILEEEEDSDF